MKSLYALALALTALITVAPATLADSEAQMSGGSEATTQSSTSANTQNNTQAKTQSSSQAARQSTTEAAHHSNGPRAENNVSRRPVAKVQTYNVHTKTRTHR